LIGSSAATILKPEWVRIFVYSGLSDGYIPDRYIGLLKAHPIPRILRKRAGSGIP
jgi:hypothetical protein